MASQEKQAANPPEAGQQNAAIEAYLDRLCASLKTVSPARRAEIRREVQGHLQMLIARQENAPDALQKALAQFGEPERVGRTMARRARWDQIRLSWRTAPWRVRIVFFSLLLIGFWGAAVTVEFCRWMQWGHNLMAWFIIGPLLPLLMGFWWGTRSMPTRRGYLFIGLVALFLAAFFPIPGQFAHANMDEAGRMDLSGLVRFTYMILWLWISCCMCGVLRILLGSPTEKSDIATA